MAPTVLVAPDEPRRPALPPAKKVRSFFATAGLLVLGSIVSMIVFFALLLSIA